MKTIPILVLSLFFTFVLNAQKKDPLSGAWQRKTDSTTVIWVISEGYFMMGTFVSANHRFLSAMGGKCKTTQENMELEVEFNSQDKEDVGNFHLFTVSVKGSTLTTRHHEESLQWSRVDDGKPGLLFGGWLFSGRKTSPADTLQPYTPGVRKTMKILSGTRFQWAAYNTQTREFFGTGGGTYTTINGQYTENIDFFSRDNSRVGASLSFQMEIKEPHWLHSGKSSKGDPIYERWSRRNSFQGQ